ncbi:MAG: GNAT family N-acetyltransferase [Polyangiaceae bacterium]|nr:GNAT family N-acetyltransferase [Polyangiaceae bacterium]
MEIVLTPRLSLEPITLALVEAVFRGDRAELETITRARIPSAWPGRVLVERAFSTSLDAVRADPIRQLWGSRLIVTRGDERIVVGSVVFHGAPDAAGVVEIGYGVEETWQRLGIASEATCAVVAWALAQPDVLCIAAITPPWHMASIRVLEKAGLTCAGLEEHDGLGEVVRFEKRRGVHGHRQ